MDKLKLSVFVNNSKIMDLKEGETEIFVFLIGEAGFPYSPVAVPLGGVVYFAAVLGKAHSPLPLRRAGYAAGRLVVDGRHENIAPGLQSHLFAIGRSGNVHRPERDAAAYLVFQYLVFRNADLQLGGLLALTHGIEVAVI